LGGGRKFSLLLEGEAGKANHFVVAPGEWREDDLTNLAIFAKNQEGV